MIAACYKKFFFQGWTLILHREACPDEICKIISSKAVEYPGQNSLKLVQATDKSRVFEGFFKFRGKSTKAYVKQFLRYLSCRYVKYFVLTSRAKKAFIASLMLEKNGVMTPDTLALMEKKHGPFCTDSILITSDVPDSMQLGEKLNNLSSDYFTNTFKKKRMMIKEFGKVVGEMHKKGIMHGDLRLRNVLVQEKAGEFLFWFIDNERTKRINRFSSRHARKNLVQISVRVEIGNTDRMRFLQAYAHQLGMSRKETKAMARKVLNRIWWRKKKIELKKVLISSKKNVTFHKKAQ